MDLVSNPFFILRIGTQHSRQEIAEASEAFALDAQADRYLKAKAMVTHPRNRIAAEISWLPGVAPQVALALVDRIKTAPKAIGAALPQLHALARCNLIAMLLQYHNIKDAKLIGWVQFLAKAYDEIDPEQLLAHLNQDREVGGFSSIPSRESVDAELATHRQYLSGVMRDLLDKATRPDNLMTEIVNTATDEGKAAAMALVEELTDKYQVEVQRYLDQLTEQIRTVLATAQSAPSIAMTEKLGIVEDKVRIWSNIAQPIQIIMRSKGLDDQASLQLANELRNAALFLANQHNMHPEAMRMSAFMLEEFKHLPLFSQAVREDIDALEKILTRQKNNGVDPELENAFLLDLEMGLLFKDKLSINAAGIRYNGTRIKLADVDRVRWGILVQYVNGIKSSSYYTIWIGSAEHSIKIECSKLFQSGNAEERYRLILDSLWKAVCVRLVNQTLSRLSRGERIRYGSIVVDNEGIELRKSGFFSSQARHTKWEDVAIGNGKGTFFLESSKEKNLRTHLSYRDVHNVHILEAVMRFLWKDGNLGRFKSGQFK